MLSLFYELQEIRQRGLLKEQRNTFSIGSDDCLPGSGRPEPVQGRKGAA
jgi:hypothetical protein